jgi:hypothetical protein
MNDPLLKATEQPLAPEEEAELTRRLSEAYCRTEEIAHEPAFERTQQKISKHLERLNAGPSEELRVPETGAPRNSDPQTLQTLGPNVKLGTG